MVNPDAVGLAMEHLVVLGRPAVRLEGRDGLPLPAPLADLRARVDDGFELIVGEVRVQHVGPGGLRAGHELTPAWRILRTCGRGRGQCVGDGLGGADREGGAAHDGGVELYRHDHHAVVRSGQVGVEGEALYRGAVVDDADVVVACAVVEREAKALLAQERLVLVDGLDCWGGGALSQAVVLDCVVEDGAQLVVYGSQIGAVVRLPLVVVRAHHSVLLVNHVFFLGGGDVAHPLRLEEQRYLRVDDVLLGEPGVELELWPHVCGVPLHECPFRLNPPEMPSSFSLDRGGVQPQTRRKR